MPAEPSVLYLDTFTITEPGPPAASSDALGYGITASDAICAGLSSRGFTVRRPRIDAVPGYVGTSAERSSWIVSSYATVLETLAEAPPDLVFCFHSFTCWPAEIRRMAQDLRITVPIVGYTHGSHWDPTDAVRFERYPGLQLQDLSNLAVLDRVLVVSDYLRDTLRRTVGQFNADLGERLQAKLAVVGLPLDADRIDACRDSADRRTDHGPVTVVFNHAAVSSKNPALFARVIARLLPRGDVRVLFTRDFPPSAPGGPQVAELARSFPDRVILGRNMPLTAYYQALWAADIQVSTASHESLGVATLEAMYTATCCILPRLGSYPEIVRGDKQALYEPGEEPLAQRLTHFLDSPDHRRAAAERMRQYALAYHPDLVTDRIAHVLRSVLTTPAST